jgi:hypothetical protein
VLGLMGGLYGSISSALAIVVTILTSVGLITSVTKNLFFYKKDFKDEELPSARCARNYMDDKAPMNLGEKENLI